MEYMVRRTTYDKLQVSLQAFADEGWQIEPPVYVGGRDWVIVCKRGDERPATVRMAEMTPEAAAEWGRVMTAAREAVSRFDRKDPA